MIKEYIYIFLEKILSSKNVNYVKCAKIFILAMNTAANRRAAFKRFADVLEFFQDVGEDDARRRTKDRTWSLT